MVEVVKVPNPDLENMMQIALASLEAGEALPDIAESRAVTSPAYKYGMHLGNWTDGGSAGLERELGATLPTSTLFMDNVKGQPLNLQLERLKAKGVKPILIYRPYFAPSGGTSGAAIEDYANGAVIRFRDEYLPHDLIEEAYHEGRVIFKLFNETNIGGEGFARGRAGFADALRCWKQARGIVKTGFPLAKFMSIANTPGNDDVYFSGDGLNLPYWYHGAEAAKANPTASEIAAAVASCPFREMFQLCDVIGIHVYAQDERQTRGDLQTWYGRRHEQALKFLQPYIAQGKKMIISEWDCGYDQQPNPQQARAELCVWWLANVVGPNPAILTTNHWWNSDDGEGAITWEKHQTRKGGEFRPVVNAVKAFREGALPPVEPPPTNPVPVPPTTGLPPRVEIDLPSFVTITNAAAVPGERFWRAVRVERKRGDANGGQHHIYHWQPHNAAVTMVVGVEQTTVVYRIPHDKPANEPAANHAMSGGGNRYWSKVEGLGIAKSDQINGMTMPQNQHESFHITWELVTQPIEGFMIDRRYMGRAGMGENYGARPVGIGVDGIILHHTGGSFAGSLDWLTNATSGVGAHYLINTDGAIYQLVEDAHAAWHAGYSILNGREDCNRFTLGIELVNAGDGQQPYPQAQQDALVWLLKEKAREHEITRMWVETHQKVRADFKARYPTATNPDGSPIGYKTDPRGLDVSAILSRVYPPVVPPLPPQPQWTQEDAAKAAYFMEEMARAMRGDTDARTRLIGALVNEPPRVGAHNVIVAVGLPPVYEERD